MSGDVFVESSNILGHVSKGEVAISVFQFRQVGGVVEAHRGGGEVAPYFSYCVKPILKSANYFFNI